VSVGTFADGLVLLVALEHAWFLVLEMFLWTKPLGLRTFRMTADQARASAALAANQGLYNGFLAAGLFWSVLGASPGAAQEMKIFLLGCVVVAGVFGARTVSPRIFLVQAVPAILALLLVVLGSGALRATWYPYYRSRVGVRDHADVLRTLAPRHRDRLRAAAAERGIAYPPSRLTLVGLKDERTLEVWAEAGRRSLLLRSYPVLAASGGSGPKRREGDGQVPEGVYRLTGFNPNSSYHLSIRVDYPNADDRAAAREEGRTRLGGDIFIHGKAVSIGCLALGDDAIEELYLLLADVGLRNSRLLLSPAARPDPARADAPWVGRLYARLGRELRAVRSGT
jgi:uncharacterized membrane protein